MCWGVPVAEEGLETGQFSDGRKLVPSVGG